MTQNIYFRCAFTVLVSVVLGSATTFAQYCGGGPSSPVDSNVESVQITGVSSFINHTAPCPGVLGVQNLTAQSVTLAAGANYHLYVQFGTCNGNYAGGGQAWIDYNQNFVFEASEALGSWSGTPPTALSDFAFTVPMGATNGTTRMRVTQQEGTFPPLNPCASFTWGSVMDFTVVITSGVSCSGYTGDVIGDAIAVPSLPFIDTNNTSICYTNNFLVYNSPDVYYRFITSPSCYDIHISTCGSSYDTYISLLNSNGNLITYNDDGFTCGNNSDIFYAQQGVDTFYVVVEGWNLSSGEFILEIEQNSGLHISTGEIPKIELFPNPAQTSFQLGGIQEKTMVHLSDANGKWIKSVLAYPSTPIGVDDLIPGLYVVTVTTQKGNFHSKLVIQRL